MFAGKMFGRWFAGAAILGAVAVSSGCSDDDPRPLPTAVAMRLTVGNQTVGINTLGACTGCPLVIPNNATIRAQFYKADGLPDENAPEGEYQLSVSVPAENTTGITFTRDPEFAFRGSFTRTTPANNQQLTFGLFDTISEVSRFGPFNVTVNIQ